MPLTARAGAWLLRPLPLAWVLLLPGLAWARACRGRRCFLVHAAALRCAICLQCALWLGAPGVRCWAAAGLAGCAVHRRSCPGFAGLQACLCARV